MSIGILILLVGLIANVPRFAMVFIVAEGVALPSVALSVAGLISGAGNGILITGGVGYVIHQWMDARTRGLVGWKHWTLLGVAVALLLLSAFILSPWIAGAVTGRELAAVLDAPGEVGALTWAWSIVLVLSVDLSVAGVMAANGTRKSGDQLDIAALLRGLVARASHERQDSATDSHDANAERRIDVHNSHTETQSDAESGHQCEWCGRAFASAQGVSAHLRFCDAYKAHNAQEDASDGK